MWACPNRGNLPGEPLCTPSSSFGDKAGPIGGLPACFKLWRMLLPVRAGRPERFAVDRAA